MMTTETTARTVNHGISGPTGRSLGLSNRYSGICPRPYISSIRYLQYVIHFGQSRQQHIILIRDHDKSGEGGPRLEKAMAPVNPVDGIYKGHGHELGSCATDFLSRPFGPYSHEIISTPTTMETRDKD
jgi:hypothetical protein